MFAQVYNEQDLLVNLEPSKVCSGLGEGLFTTTRFARFVRASTRFVRASTKFAHPQHGCNGRMRVTFEHTLFDVNKQTLLPHCTSKQTLFPIVSQHDKVCWF